IHSPNELRKYFYVTAMLFILFQTPLLSLLPPQPTRGVPLAAIITSFSTVDPCLRVSQLNNRYSALAIDTIGL
ncbi:hypothetical protein JB92DRAFT_2924216, partial [Gautieria morchelliformis]